MEDQSKRFEKINTNIFDNAKAASAYVVQQIVELIKAKAANNENCILGLATGSTPTEVYRQLIELHKNEGLSFKNVITFNLDEYYPMQPNDLQSYVRFMNEYLFDHIDILKENINIPDGTVAKENVSAYCQQYEAKIDQVGGLDLQLLGIGRTGHIGFNEPGSGISSLTRLVTLDHITVTDAASDFFGEENVPIKAITMGVGSILKAKKVIMMAWGEGKAPIIKEAIEGKPSETVPATYLQQHQNVEAILDAASSEQLTRIKTPWLTNYAVNWNEELIKRAAIWLSLHIQKPILKLTNRDYSENGMSDLVTEYDTAYNINLKVFNDLRETITGWPAGKKKKQKRVVIFSPHPDDDVISMGGTFIRLVDHGHEVHVAYQTSGNIAVFDDEVVRFVDFVNDYNKKLGLEVSQSQEILNNIKAQIKNKAAGQVDSPEIQKIKSLIRRGEAKAGCRYVGIDDAQAHFLDLPFYETGKVKKKPLSQADVTIIIDLLEEIQPHQIYAAGDLSDPHGTHRVCLQAIFKAVNQLKAKRTAWLKACEIWLYRGAWQEWSIEQVDMAIPLSPGELLRKRRAIFKHQSQKDRPLFPGSDSREFWQRAEERNRTTAQQYDQLGLPEYEAIEAFKKWEG